MKSFPVVGNIPGGPTRFPPSSIILNSCLWAGCKYEGFHSWYMAKVKERVLQMNAGFMLVESELIKKEIIKGSIQ
jgi:hypothetical protein